MRIAMAQDQLFASFLLDKSQGLEIALRTESVTEATPITGMIRPLPATLDFVEGIMHLRDEAIPIINVKKRLGLVQQEYDKGAMVAVVNLRHRRYGLLFDEIKEVFAARAADVRDIDDVLQTEDKIISALVQAKNDGRTVEVLDIKNLFLRKSLHREIVEEPSQDTTENQEIKYLRYVIFKFSGQSFGVPVECTREITFFDADKHLYQDKIDRENLTFNGSLEDIFKHGDIDGVLTLRGRKIPVLSAKRILSGTGISGEMHLGENSRILILSDDKCAIGIVVEEVTMIETIRENEIMPLNLCKNAAVSGVYQKEAGHNIMLLDMENLVCNRMEELRAMGRLSCQVEEVESANSAPVVGAHHILTENCYLVFSVGRKMAVQLKDVQEIIEKEGVLGVPGGSGYSYSLINLRGLIVPVVNLREFFGFKKDKSQPEEQKLIICRTDSQTLALEVDGIVTIYKQEQYQNTSSLKPELADKKDTLERLIAFEAGVGSREHVLVVNIHNLIRNHLDVAAV